MPFRDNTKTHRNLRRICAATQITRNHILLYYTSKSNLNRNPEIRRSKSLSATGELHSQIGILIVIRRLPPTRRSYWSGTPPLHWGRGGGYCGRNNTEWKVEQKIITTTFRDRVVACGAVLDACYGGGGSTIMSATIEEVHFWLDFFSLNDGCSLILKFVGIFMFSVLFLKYLGHGDWWWSMEIDDCPLGCVCHFFFSQSSFWVTKGIELLTRLRASQNRRIGHQSLPSRSRYFLNDGAP